jgi:glyoxylase-like metal-dependent hydrolase (beta-lactamase superfamily II)
MRETAIPRRAVLAAGAGAALLPQLAASQPQPLTHQFTVGALQVTVVQDGTATNPDATRSVVNATPEQVLAALAAAGTPGPAMANTYNQTAVRTSAGIVLFDVGFGPQGGPPGSGRMFDGLRAAGIDPAAVTTVAFTHFHGDHIGGLLDANGGPAFPNAAILVPEREWSFWMDDGEASRATEARRPAFANARRRFGPYAQRVQRFAPGATIAPGVTAVASNGHAPGHTCFLLADGSAQCLVLGDAITSPALYMANPEWYPGFDMDPPMAVATRKALLDRAVADRLTVIGYHFPMPATGRVERAGTGFRLVMG